MLKEVTIKNFAVIEYQRVSFDEGLHVISGESGTGKSVLLQALEVILGGRAKQKYLRANTDGWAIEALFDLHEISDSIRQKIPEAFRELNEIAVSRSMNQQGRGRVYINGSLATLQTLTEICSLFVQVCAQGGQSRLLDPGTHLQFIDNYVGNEALLSKYQELWSDYSAKRKMLAEHTARQQQGVLRRAELTHIVEELQALNLEPDLRTSLEGQISESMKGAELLATSQEVLSQVQDEEGVVGNLHAIKLSLDRLTRLKPELSSFTDSLSRIEDELYELEIGLRKVADTISVDEELLERSRNALSVLAQSERKYRTDVDGLISLYEQALHELELYYDDDSLQNLQTDLENSYRELHAHASKLTASRKKATAQFLKDVGHELEHLNMPKNALHIEAHHQELGPSGAESVEILLQSADGKKRFSLKEVASGGELSRILLILKKILKDKTGISVLVFDEVDTGVSGSVARAVGEKLKSISEGTQVLCITHLPQVASLADRHYLVSNLGGKSEIVELDEQQKVEEIARMLAGYQVTDASRESARELLSSI